MVAMGLPSMLRGMKRIFAQLPLLNLPLLNLPKLPRVPAALALTVLLGAINLPAAAADLPQPYRYGFSPDGAYHLMLTRWTRGGSGFPAAHLRVVRQGVGVMLEDELVLENRPELPAQTPEQLAEALLTKHAARLAELGLTQPVPGHPLWAQAPANPALAGWPPQSAQVITFPQHAVGGVSTIEVRPQAVFNTCEQVAMLPQEPLGLRLRVNGQDWFRDRTQLPKNRACITAYRLEAAWQQGEAVAVLLRAYGPGFEGPDALPLTLLGRVTPTDSHQTAPATTEQP